MIAPRHPIKCASLVLLGWAIFAPHALANKRPTQSPPLLCQKQDRWEPCEDTQKLEKPKTNRAERPKPDRGHSDFKAREVGQH